MILKRAKIRNMNLKLIDEKEQKILLLKMLEFFDDICRKNGISYSLIGGSLIGAVRHHGFIPWDDDIDIILTKKNYDRLKEILSKQAGRYQMLKYGRGGEKFSFIKLIDTYTQVLGVDQWKFDPDYGVFVDIFCYYPTSMQLNERRSQCRKIKMLISLNVRRRLNFKKDSLGKNIVRAGKNIVSIFLGYRKIRKMFESTLEKYKDEDTNYVISNWPIYGFEKEIQLKKNTEDYVDAKFENLTVMIFKNYDEILRTTYGDYMQLPPEPQRKPRHDMKIWWKDENEKLDTNKRGRNGK